MKKVLLLISTILLISCTEKKVDCNNNSAYKFGKDLGFSAKLSGTTSFESAYDAYENQISSIGAAMPYQKNDQCVKQGFEDESSK